MASLNILCMYCTYLTIFCSLLIVNQIVNKNCFIFYFWFTFIGWFITLIIKISCFYKSYFWVTPAAGWIRNCWHEVLAIHSSTLSQCTEICILGNIFCKRRNHDCWDSYQWRPWSSILCHRKTRLDYSHPYHQWHWSRWSCVLCLYSMIVITTTLS